MMLEKTVLESSDPVGGITRCRGDRSPCLLTPIACAVCLSHRHAHVETAVRPYLAAFCFNPPAGRYKGKLNLTALSSLPGVL